MIELDGVATVNHVKRALIYVHYNKNDELSEYVIYQLEKLKHFYKKIVILSNSKLTDSSLIRLEKYADAVIQRNNIGSILLHGVTGYDILDGKLWKRMTN